MSQATAQEIKDSIMCYTEDRLQTLVDLCESKDKRIEELEVQLKTAGVRAVIEAYDRGAMKGDIIYNLIYALLDGFGDRLPEEWMYEVGSIWADWDEEAAEEPEALNKRADHYIDRIRAVIGTEKTREE